MKVAVRGAVVARLNSEIVAQGSNLVVDNGEALIAGWLSGATSAAPGYMSIGDGTDASTATMAGLSGTEHTRIAMTASQVGNVVGYSAGFGTSLATTVTVGEVGLFNGATGGTMLARFTTSTFTMDQDDVLDIVWQLTIGD